jgi:folate-binding protein YgfZ
MTSPLFEKFRAEGVPFRSAGGSEVPARFGSFDEECRAAAESCALIDLSHFGKIVFSGPDRLSFLNGLLTNDLKNLPAGRAVWTCLLTHKGKLVADFALYSFETELVAIHFPQATPLILQGLAKYLPLSDTKAEDIGASWGAFYLRGPKAREVAEKVSGQAVGTAECGTVSFEGTPLRVLKYPPGEEGILLLFSAEKSEVLWEALRKAGAVRAGYDLFEAWRVEAGRPELGVDANADSFPATVGLEGALSYTKGCYLGQETTTRLKTQGRPKEKMVRLRIDGAAAVGDAVFSGESPVGQITSAAPACRERGVLALATVPFALSVPGTRLEVLSGQFRLSAEVLPFPSAAFSQR